MLLVAARSLVLLLAVAGCLFLLRLTLPSCLFILFASCCQLFGIGIHSSSSVVDVTAVAVRVVVGDLCAAASCLGSRFCVVVVAAINIILVFGLVLYVLALGLICCSVFIVKASSNLVCMHWQSSGLLLLLFCLFVCLFVSLLFCFGYSILDS